jgi:hypothetical protein
MVVSMPMVSGLPLAELSAHLDWLLVARAAAAAAAARPETVAGSSVTATGTAAQEAEAEAEAAEVLEEPAEEAEAGLTESSRSTRFSWYVIQRWYRAPAALEATADPEAAAAAEATLEWAESAVAMAEPVDVADSAARVETVDREAEAPEVPAIQPCPCAP